MAAPNPDRWLDGNIPLVIPRTRREARQAFTSTRKEDRALLGAGDFAKLKKSCEEGLVDKFDLLTHGDLDQTDSLRDLYSVTMRIEEFQSSLLRHDMAGVFLIPSDFVDDPDQVFDFVPALGSHPVDLFTNHAEIELDTVKSAGCFLIQAGREFHVQNLLWSGTKLLNSCTELLRSKMIEKTIGSPVECLTGPYYFKIMMDLITASSPKSMRTLLNRLQTMALKDFDGENVIRAASTIKGAIEILKNNEAVPRDILDMVFNIMKRCSTPDFVTVIGTIATNHEQRVKTTDIEHFLADAENKYMDMLNTGDWNAGTSKDNQSSVFLSQIECWNCGKKGHMSKDCRSKNRNQNNQARGRGRGRGRGGRGNRTSNNNNNNSRSQDFRKADSRFQPPKVNEPKVRKIGNLLESWCGTCKYWTNHSTDKHKELAALSDSNDNNDYEHTSEVSSVRTGRSTSRSSRTSTTISSKRSSKGDNNNAFAGMISHFG